jgi:hypothetical protein
MVKTDIITGPVTVTTEIKRLKEMVTEPNSVRERIFNGICLSFKPFAQMALLRE